MTTNRSPEKRRKNNGCAIFTFDKSRKNVSKCNIPAASVDGKKGNTLIVSESDNQNVTISNHRHEAKARNSTVNSFIRSHRTNIANVFTVYI